MTLPALRDPVERALSVAVLALSLSRGMFFAVSALYFTRSIGLSAGAVGIGLTLAGAAGVVASYAGGRISDRVGADRLQRWALAAHGCSLLAYALARDVTTFVATAACVSGSRGLMSTAEMTVLARWYAGPERVGVRARLRVVMNVAIGVGTLLAGLALLADTATAYRTTIVAVGVVTLAGVAPLLRLRGVPGFAARMSRGRVAPAAGGPAHARVERSGAGGRPGRGALHDRTYLAATALNAVKAIQFAITSVGLPLWVADHTAAPTVVVSALLVLNTAYVALFQARASRNTHDLTVAGRTVRRGGLALLACCLLLAVAGGLPPLVATAVLLAAAALGAAAETLCEAGGWGLAFELADPARAGEYQGVSQLGYSLAQMLAPAVVTTGTIAHGPLGWLLLGMLFALAGAATAGLAGRADRHRSPAAAAVGAGAGSSGRTGASATERAR